MIKVLLHNKFFKFLYGIILLPLCYVIMQTLVYVVSHTEFSSRLVRLFFAGCITYVVIHFVLYKPIKIYIIGHEIVHMLSTYLCGGKVKKVKVSNSSGMVSVDKVNTFIALSPYFVPFYTIIVVILWIVLRYIVKLSISTNVLSFFLGFTLMFHFVLTLYAIYFGQQDFKISGWLFSIVLIFIINCSILLLLFIFVFPSKLEIRQVQRYFLSSLKHTYYFCYINIFNIINLLKDKIVKK